MRRHEDVLWGSSGVVQGCLGAVWALFAGLRSAAGWQDNVHALLLEASAADVLAYIITFFLIIS
jgi:hypothetical protein